ncbi:hypothetical protein SAMN05660443_1883 [Marinospirillum celere]|uniref:Uncharacterized protein n=1 Tax=Marinospirillum celere TaxID=1122252 RepID=A0A1I1HA05_9GAMM|nr:hypothetical protein [Marinospirillum celere]SFC20596.1 hypothetical protein SAMN05660443_1883 [Marinospirillum celere]
MKRPAADNTKGVPTYWKARLLLPVTGQKAYKGYWAYTQSLSEKEVRFQSEKNLKKSVEVHLEIHAIHQGVKRTIQLLGKVLSSVLLSCGTLYGIDLQIIKISKADREFLNNYMKEKQTMKLTYSSF